MPDARSDRIRAEGRPGQAIIVGREWLGWRGVIAHPNSPAGGGGPGHFAKPLLAQLDAGTMPSPWAPGPVRSTPLAGAPAPRRPNLPPRTNPRSLGVLVSVQIDLFDVKVDAEIVADGSGAQTLAETTATVQPMPTRPFYERNAHHKILKFTSKFIWHSTITIQTAYATGVGPDQLSGYGRGTTTEDVRNGDVTLGFHESCHRSDYIAYLGTHPLPDLPKLTIGMTEADFERVTTAFDGAMKAYLRATKAESDTKTDEVGYRRSTFEQTGEAFRHIVPGR